MELELRQEQQLSMRQLHSLRLLQMGRREMREYLESVAQENPTVELELPHEEEPLTRQAERWLDRWRWLEENDRQNSYYERPNQEEEDSPMNRIGTDGGLAETLESFLCRQIAGLEVPERQRQLLYWWAVWRTAGTSPCRRRSWPPGLVCRRRSCAAASHGCRRWSRRGWGLRI